MAVRLGAGVALLGVGVVIGWQHLPAMLGYLARQADGFEILAAFIGIAVLVLTAGKVKAQDIAPQRDEDPPLRDRAKAVARELTHVALWLAPGVGLVIISSLGAPGTVSTALAVAMVVWAVHHSWSERRWQAAAVALAFAAALVLQILPPPFNGLIAYADSPWTRSVLAVVIPLGLPIVLFVAVWIARPITKCLGHCGTALCTVLPVLLAMATVRELAAIWSWLGAIPLALTMGCAAAAVTTLVVPFKRHGLPDL